MAASLATGSRELGRWVVSFGLALGLSCSKSSEPAKSRVESKPTAASIEAATDPAALPAPTGSSPYAFGELVLVAGRGEVADDEHNDWQQTFEGAAAVDVELSHPYFAVADANGQVFIADKEAHGVRRVAVDGTLTTWLGTNVAGNGSDGPALGSTVAVELPNGLWLRDDGTLYVLDLGNGKIRRVDSAGVASTLATIDGGIDTGRGLWVAADERTVLFAAKTALRRWTPAGVETLADGFVSLGNLLVDEDGSVLFCDRGGNRVWRYAADGEVSLVAGSGEDGEPVDHAVAVEAPLLGPRSLAVLGGGHYIIATHRGRRLWGLGPDGRLTLVHDGETGAGLVTAEPGTIGVIRGLSRARNGDLWLTHGDDGRVHVLRAAH